jgi:hypothetical protein
MSGRGRRYTNFTQYCTGYKHSGYKFDFSVCLLPTSELSTYEILLTSLLKFNVSRYLPELKKKRFCQHVTHITDYCSQKHFTYLHSCGNKSGYTTLCELGSGCWNWGKSHTYKNSLDDVELVFPGPRQLLSEVCFIAAKQLAEARVLSLRSLSETTVIYLRLSFPALIVNFFLYTQFSVII